MLEAMTQMRDATASVIATRLLVGNPRSEARAQMASVVAARFLMIEAADQTRAEMEWTGAAPLMKSVEMTQASEGRLLMLPPMIPVSAFSAERCLRQ